MSQSQSFSQVLNLWSHIFMRRSMSAFLRNARDYGVSMQQIGVLFYLFRKEHCGVSEIGIDLGVTNAAASQMIDRLVQQGYLERSEDPHDRRGKQLVLTGRGKDLIEQIMRARQQWIEELADELTPEEQEQITTSLHLLTETAQKLDQGKKVLSL